MHKEALRRRGKCCCCCCLRRNRRRRRKRGRELLRHLKHHLSKESTGNAHNRGRAQRGLRRSSTEEGGAVVVVYDGAADAAAAAAARDAVFVGLSGSGKAWRD